MIIDTHFHTNVYTKWEGALEEALDILKKKNILVFSQTCDIEGYETTLEIAKKSDFVIPCFGLHPQVAHEYTEQLDSLKSYFNQAIVYGEIGLDHYHLKDKEQYPHQYKLLEHFFKFAQKKNKLVILHLDGAEEKGLEMIQNFSLKKVIVHCYKGSISTLKKMADYGCYFSVGGNYILNSFRSIIGVEDWNHLQTIVKEVPDELLLLETDGPSRISPDAKPEEPRSKPTHIYKSIQKVAKLRKLSEEEFLELTKKNLLSLIENDSRLVKYVQMIIHSY